MADAVPVSDVLCEAMEYLSKLGSNLRVRSDNLKNKRIRKDKLRNVHAVQKAANKVLLICELSKKSIENVETGIKTVLKQIDLSQKSTTNESGNSKYKSPNVNKVDNYEYIEYDSFRLRIRKKVDMKHYTSAKVFASKMPMSMQDKYPVFIDCNLYRIRREKFKDLDENISEEVQNSISDNNSASLANVDKNKHIKDKTTERPQNEPLKCNLIDNSKSQSGKASIKHSKRKSECETTQSDKDQSVSDKEIEFSKDQQSDDNPAEDNRKSNTDDQYNTELNQNSVSDTKQKMHDPQSNEEQASENQAKKNSNKKSPLKADGDMLSSKNKADIEDPEHRSKLSNNGSKSVKSKKFRHIKFVDDSSDSDDEKPCSKVNTEENDSVRNSKDSDENRQDKQTDKTENSREKEDVNNISNSKDSIQDNTQKTDTDTLKRNMSNEQTEDSVDLNKHTKQKTSTCDDVVELDDSSNESKTSEEKKKGIEYEYEKLNCENSEKESPKCSNKDNDSCAEENSNKKNVAEKETELVSVNDSNPRPFIRCVSLDKLIKKDVGNPETKTARTLKNSPKKTKNEILTLKQEKSPSKYFNKKKRKLYKEPSSLEESSKENDEEYWKQKRKEVEGFKPKNFVICVKRLPELSEKYLCEHNLKRITINGSVVCEVVQKLEEKNEKHTKKYDTPDVDTAKNALLCDSDSDRSKNLADTPRKVKTALLKESESEKEENIPSPGSKTGEERKSKNERQNSASDKESRNNKTPETELVNSACDKESRNSKTPEPKPVNNESDKNDELKSNENHKTPSKKIIQNISTPPSKRKNIMESMHAKKMLLTYSSSSDTEDEQLKNVLKEIRDSLLQEHSSDISPEKKKKTDAKLSSDSDSSSINVKTTKNFDANKGSSSSEDEKNSKISASISEDASSTKDTNSQIDENTEEKSNSSFKKVRRM